jgi:hypothetical protein
MRLLAALLAVLLPGRAGGTILEVPLAALADERIAGLVLAAERVPVRSYRCDRACAENDRLERCRSCGLPVRQGPGLVRSRAILRGKTLSLVFEPAEGGEFRTAWIQSLQLLRGADLRAAVEKAGGTIRATRLSGEIHVTPSEGAPLEKIAAELRGAAAVEKRIVVPAERLEWKRLEEAFARHGAGIEDWAFTVNRCQGVIGWSEERP